MNNGVEEGVQRGMPAQLIERALATWREAERLLRELPPVDADHETVRLEVVRLREAYTRLTDRSSDAAETMASCRATIDNAHQVIAAVREKRERS